MTESRIDLAALLLRLALGVMFLAHGLLKVIVFTPAGTVGFFESIGLPGPLAYVVIAAEIAAGIALVAGYRSRLVATLTLPILGGAAWVHLGNGWLFTAKGGGWEYPVFLFVVAVAVALIGDGRYAVRPAPIDAAHRPAIA
jgi:putative oxidoreductase